MTWRPWNLAWHDALYATDGFYRRPEGPSGHFATSAQGMPGVGEVLAKIIAAIARQHGLTKIVDVGCGRGESLIALHTLDPTFDLTGVDIVERPQHLPAPIRWTVSPGGPDLPPETYSQSLVIAHEWLDVVPAPVIELDSKGEARVVEVTRNGEERLGAPAAKADREWCRTHWPLGGEGHRAEVGHTREEAWNALCNNVSDGLVIAVDYGHVAQTRPPYGTLTGFRNGREAPPVPDGGGDITAHVAIDSLPADRRVRQGDLVVELELIPNQPEIALARNDPPRYLAELAARSAALFAAARPGPGDFWWVIRKV